MGMEVYEGKPKQSWTYKAVGELFEKDDVLEQSGAPRPRMMMLTSDKGWPYSGIVGKYIHDCHVNCEVERAWQIFKGDITEWLSSDRGTEFTPKRRVLIGTPGIGNSMAAGSYLLYQLLHHDAEQLQVVAHCLGGTAYVFDRTISTVSVYMSEPRMIKFVKELSLSRVKAYIIYDVGCTWKILSPCLPPGEWGMLVVAAPETTSYIHWVGMKRAARTIVNCPDESDVKAMCVWRSAISLRSSKRNTGER
ncbi:putative retrotransposon hot spot (RHS) protein [Trypanosoma cruzi]|uniref:Putative retrotransposon hot spot (RHS) protein n=1 Tax=Trypanosoma cruzi TaxID=5693 RepID=A0A2V2WRR1_TRYCR|nr:putative retrotransposon hot spot (RHS) protein [Trypanosoma cruzi]